MISPTPAELISVMDLPVAEDKTLPRGVLEVRHGKLYMADVDKWRTTREHFNRQWTLAATSPPILVSNLDGSMHEMPGTPLCRSCQREGEKMLEQDQLEAEPCVRCGMTTLSRTGFPPCAFCKKG